MSLIFDALQRSEAERSGVDLSALSAATEVLQLCRASMLPRNGKSRAFSLSNGLSWDEQHVERDTAMASAASAPPSCGDS